MKLFFNRQQSIKAGDETVTYTENPVPVGEPVTFFSQMGQFLGTKPIAKGVVIAAVKDELPILTPTKTGQPPKNPYRNIYRVKVTEIVEKQ